MDDVLIICQEAGFRLNVNLNALEHELGTSTATFGDLLRHLTASSPTLRALNRTNELVFHYANQDRRPVPVRIGDSVRAYASYQTFFLQPMGRRALTSIPGYPPQHPPHTHASYGNSNLAWLFGVAGVLLIIGLMIWGSMARSSSFGTSSTVATNYSSPTSSSDRNNPAIFKTSDAIFSISWSPDGNYLATGGDREPVEVWEASTGKKVLTYSGHGSDAIVNSVAWSPDGKYIASGADDDTVQVWNARTGKTSVTYNCVSTVHTLTWSPDGNYLACSGNNVQIFNAATGQQVLILGNFSAVNVLAWSPDGRTIAVAVYSSGEVQFWDANTGQQESTYKADADIKALAWSPDGKYIAAGKDNNAVQIWNTSTGETVVTYTAHTDMVKAVGWSPDGKYLASGATDATLQVRNAQTGKQVVAYTGLANAVFSLAWSPDGKYLAAGLYDGTIEIWNMHLG